MIWKILRDGDSKPQSGKNGGKAWAALRLTAPTTTAQANTTAPRTVPFGSAFFCQPPSHGNSRIQTEDLVMRRSNCF